MAEENDQKYPKTNIFESVQFAYEQSGELTELPPEKTNAERKRQVTKPEDE
ncbi:hypothetical protein [Melghirimyces algeriensis]|uniref:YfhE-like protein n=1 Tax=Melghirimyces algeriensis TaxID=910412 RepID=A0A521ENQ4_9BACL|nr:hypothetical protein [Melghirimyces algeriensis]SMO85543.1 hypothetical protein SAMN06264849_11027 [Melghirimyces algeriensis]